MWQMTSHLKMNIHTCETFENGLFNHHSAALNHIYSFSSAHFSNAQTIITIIVIIECGSIGAKNSDQLTY